ncbi:hypothetical protein EDM76_02905 [bacterium]|nr:MAG: hypothetical protein EDM76_02905 [bacterium]
MWGALRLPTRFADLGAESDFLAAFRESGLRLAKIAFVIGALMAFAFWLVLAIAPAASQASISRQSVPSNISPWVVARLRQMAAIQPRWTRYMGESGRGKWLASRRQKPSGGGAVADGGATGAMAGEVMQYAPGGWCWDGTMPHGWRAGKLRPQAAGCYCHRSGCDAYWWLVRPGGSFLCWHVRVGPEPEPGWRNGSATDL